MKFAWIFPQAPVSKVCGGGEGVLCRDTIENPSTPPIPEYKRLWMFLGIGWDSQSILWVKEMSVFPNANDKNDN